MQRYAVPLALAIVLAVVALFMRGKGGGCESPEDAVTSLFEAASRGDAPAYLNLLADTLRTPLESTRAQLGSRDFAASLRKTAAGIKGIALTRSGAGGDNQVVLDAELVFSDHAERQRFTLEGQTGSWTIVNIDRAMAVKPDVAYGTPVFEEPVPNIAPTQNPGQTPPTTRRPPSGTKAPAASPP